MPTKQVVGTTLAPASERRPTRKGCPNHPIEFKRELAAAACAPGISVAKLAMAHGVNANLLFKWRRHYRAGKFGTLEPTHASAIETARSETPVTLLPVVHPGTLTAPRSRAPTAASIEIVLASATVRVCGDVGTEQLRTVLDCLVQRA